LPRARRECDSLRAFLCKCERGEADDDRTYGNCFFKSGEHHWSRAFAWTYEFAGWAHLLHFAQTGFPRSCANRPGDGTPTPRDATTAVPTVRTISLSRWAWARQEYSATKKGGLDVSQSPDPESLGPASSRGRFPCGSAVRSGGLVGGEVPQRTEERPRRCARTSVSHLSHASDADVANSCQRILLASTILA